MESKYLSLLLLNNEICAYDLYTSKDENGT